MFVLRVGSINSQLLKQRLQHLFQAQAYALPEGVLVKMTCYTGAYTGAYATASICWLLEQVVPFNAHFFKRIHEDAAVSGRSV